MSFLQKLERKIGKYSIKHLTRYIIGAYVIGYILALIGQRTGSSITGLLTLYPDMILQGQVWRIISWVLIPPSSISIFTVIMLICYYQLGTILERVWGDFLYNVYIFTGIITTIIGAFIMSAVTEPLYFALYSGMGAIFSTYYISLSILLGFAMTFPDQQMLLFFFIPIKIKYLAIFDVALLTYDSVNGLINHNPFILVVIICSLAATILFFIMTRKNNYRKSRMDAQNRKRQQEFQKAMARGRAQRAATAGTDGVRHKCCVCGRTEKDDPNLEFRYCSKCNGNYEYCQDHLFTHVHK